MEGYELHHIIFRSQASYMAKVPINFKYLTPEQHRGDIGPHKNRKRDLELKKELQAKLKIMFCNSHYTLEQIKEILGVGEKTIKNYIRKYKLREN